jgi:hypothetical protein
MPTYTLINGDRQIRSGTVVRENLHSSVLESLDRDWTQHTFIATAGQTALIDAGFTDADQYEVRKNGLLLNDLEYTIADGQITLAEPLLVDEVVVVFQGTRQGAAGLSDSPFNGLIHGRKDGAWVIIPASSGGTATIDRGFVLDSVSRLGSETRVWSLADLGNGVVLAGTNPTGQVWRSTDSGASWSLVQQLGSETYVLSLVDIGNGVVLAGTGLTGQVWRSTDSGASWSLVQQLGSETRVWSLADLGNGVVLAGTSPTGQVWRSTDSGASWSLVQQLGSETYVLSLVDIGNGVVLAGTSPTGQVYRGYQYVGA